MVRFTLKRSLREASCCSLLVVKGGAALRRRSFLSTLPNHPVGFFQGDADLFRFFAVVNFDLLFTFSDESGVESRRLAGREVGIDRPVFFLFERLDLAFTFDDQTQSNGLHASRGETSTHFIPEQRGNLISNQAVENTARLLRVHQILINGAGMFECGLHGALGDLVESHALNARRSFGFALLRFLRLFFLGAVSVEFESKMRGDGFAFAVRVRRQIDRIRRRGQLFQLGDNLFFAGDDDVIRLEIIINVHTQRALGQILDMPQRRLDREPLTQIFLDGLRLGRRFDND